MKKDAWPSPHGVWKSKRWDSLPISLLSLVHLAATLLSTYYAPTWHLLGAGDMGTNKAGCCFEGLTAIAFKQMLPAILTSPSQGLSRGRAALLR